MNRRKFIVSGVAGVAGATAAGLVVIGLSPAAHSHSHMAHAQQPSQPGAGVVDMPESAYKPVKRAAKPGATPVMTVREVEDMERNLACPCPCTLDVYTCRTTDFNCGISPAVHSDIKQLVEGGYSADEIMTALTDTYGDFILMTPRKEGFNLLAWFAPFAALGIGAVVIGTLLRSWRRSSELSAQNAEHIAHTSPTHDEHAMDATPEEMARLHAALRDGE